MANSDYRQLKVWQQAIQVVKHLYQVTSTFPESERYGLCSQMQRSAVSIPSNIAEGHYRNSTKEELQFLGIARGSVAELQTQIIISHEIGFIEETKMIEMTNELTGIDRMIVAYMKKISQDKS